MLAITLAGFKHTTPDTFFTDLSKGLDSEYSAYTIENDFSIPGDPIDVWVRTTNANFGPGKVSLAPHEDGIYHVGPLANGEIGTAFLYFTASGVTETAQDYVIEVWDHDPSTGGSALLTKMFTYTEVQDAIKADPNQITSVMLSPASPAVGDTLEMKVVGELGTNAERVLFTPATSSAWLPDVFELRGTTVTISGATANAPPQPPQLYFDSTSLPPPVGRQEFEVVYSFLVTGPTQSPTPTSPTQYCEYNDQPKYKHHNPLGTTFPDIPVAKYKLDLSKGDGTATYTPGGTTTYTIVLANTGNVDVSNVAIEDAFPSQLGPGTYWTVAYVDASKGTLPDGGTFPGPISGTVNLKKLTGTVTITIVGKILSSALGDMINTVTATAPDGTLFTASDKDTYLPDVNVKLEKSDGVTTYTPGGTTTYTITLTNNGLSDVTGLSFLDTLPVQLGPGTTWQASYAGTGTLPKTVQTSSTISGVVDVLKGTGGVPGTGGTVTITVAGKILSSATGPMTNTVDVTSSLTGKLSATDVDTCVPNPVLSISKSGPALYIPGATLTYTITVSNLQGPSDAPNVHVLDALPPEIVSWSWEVTFGGGATIYTGSPDSGIGAIDTRINLPVGGVATFSIKDAKTSPSATTDILNTATAIPSNGGEPVQAQWLTSLPIIPTEGVPALVVGSDDGCNGRAMVTVLNERAGLLAQFDPYPEAPSFRGGVRVFSADVTGDGVAEIIVAPSRNYPGEVRVFSRIPVASLNYTLLPEYTFYPFGKSYRGGVEVASGDFNGDGMNDILCGQSTGAGMVSAFVVTPPPTIPGPIGYKAVSSVPYFSFRGFSSPYAGGVMVGAGDFGTFIVNGNGKTTAKAIPKFMMTTAPDGRSEVVVGSNAGMRATVNVYAVTGAPNVKPTLTLVKTLNPFAATFRGGVTLSASPPTQLLSPNLPSDLYVGAGVGGKSLVEVYKGGTWTKSTITAFSSFAKPNARVFAAPVDIFRNGVADDVFGVQGLGGAGGTNGVMPASTGIPRTTGLKPALRIAPIVDSLLLLSRR